MNVPKSHIIDPMGLLSPTSPTWGALPSSSYDGAICDLVGLSRLNEYLFDVLRDGESFSEGTTFSLMD
eukprot:CAMPEP_0171409584 /NCGR_PEP_ID=MMETSP0880-20121228/25008_1 /TAXON_ID=67004 /ORGANISM="Thalassiosira weissflogii, Strain CCMP1336" /LENGTH=67 /DNA_ID=CAMNT_0011926133 /DNA_START=70 /DNA_END=270 /DNA_ORIENTATION=-